MIQPVICEVRQQIESVRRLVQFAKDLDGTEIKVIQLSPEEDAAHLIEYPLNAKSCKASFALRHCALAMKGKPFIWVEHDSIPLKAGWVKALSEEYDRLGKPFMISSDSNPPDDYVGGIGIYSSETHWMVPSSYRKSAWDLWMLENLRPLISRTNLIQHSYGVYDKNHIAKPHRFPRDAGMLREQAVIFHRDVNQDLMRPGSQVPPPRVFYHSGDLGDIVYHLKTIQVMGGGVLMLGSNMGLRPTLPSHCREPMTHQRFLNIAPLLTTQPYIRSVVHWDKPPDASWINLNAFRETFRAKEGPTCCNLQRASLRRFTAQPQEEVTPWLTSSNEPGLEPKIMISRSSRYHDPRFPWKQIVERYRSELCFLGLASERDAFEDANGDVQWWPSKDLGAVARAINGAKIFIGNQSCPYAIAEGLKKPCVQESWMRESNCLFCRPHVLYRETDFKKISAFIDKYI